MTNHSLLATNRSDVAAAVARGTLGAIPWVGNALAEIVSAFIPGQKLDRVTDFASTLATHFAQMQERQSLLEERLRTPEGSDLLEEGIIQSCRAVSPERRARIAGLVANGLSGEQITYDRTKKLLSILEGLTDSEVILLYYHSQVSTIGSEWHRALREKYPDLLNPVSREVGVGGAERERGALRESYERTLVATGLLERGQAGLTITRLGSLILQGGIV
jgi:hypothetical protein